MPVIAQIGLTGFSGRVAAVGQAGLRELQFPHEVDGTECVLLVPAPLPTSRIESIFFQSRDDRLACERSAKDFGNVQSPTLRWDQPRTETRRPHDEQAYAMGPSPS